MPGLLCSRRFSLPGWPGFHGARLLAPVFARPRAWAVLDVVIALVMWSIAITLILGQTSAV